MKKLFLAAVNSQYSHTNLAVRILRAVSEPFVEVVCEEFNINQPSFIPYRHIISSKPNFLGFSCYIWNIDYILKLARDIKSALPEVIIILGGPEVSFKAKELKRDYPFIDYIICGEAEQSFPLLLKSLIKETTHSPSQMYELDDAFPDSPFPYENLTHGEAENRLIYYETARGCPFRCTYCLSGSISEICPGGSRLRELSIDRVKREVKFLASRGVKTLKLVDRTFNANKSRAAELMRFFSSGTGDMCIHLEIAADLLNDEMLEILSSAPKGKFQIEAGIQSFNENTLEAVRRKTNLELVRNNILALTESGNCHVHIDLIAGLPLEGFESFKHSFNKAYALNADMLQLGFLKVLPGSVIETQCEKYGIVYRHYAPYEVISTDCISHEEVIKLKCMSYVLDVYYNKARNREYIEFVVDSSQLTPFELFSRLSEYLDERGLLDRPMSSTNQYEVLRSFAEDYFGIIIPLPPPKLK